MDNGEILKKSLLEYKEQLEQVELALENTEEGEDRNNLLDLQSSIKQLISLTESSLPPISDKDDEYSLFMSEMVKEGAIEIKSDIEEELKTLEGMKCRAPHQHTWGDLVYHNALVCTVIRNESDIFVKVLFTNPTHQEMLPCPYFLESECKFSEDKCHFSHGEIIPFFQLQEYIEPEYENLQVGSAVLAKNDKLWYKAVVKRLFKEKILIKIECNNKEMEVEFSDVFPLNDVVTSENNDDDDVPEYEDIINMSLMVTPTNERIGGWEKFTKGIGSKLLEKMGYVVGTGLGKRSDGRVEPVSAVILPPGKSLDHCMDLREKAGGDKNLFSVERKLKKLQRRQEIKNQKIYERESKKVDVFNFLNNTLATKTNEPTVLTKTQHRREIKTETSRNLNVESLKIDEKIKEIERDMIKIRAALKRHKDKNSQVHKQLALKLNKRQEELDELTGKAFNIKHEQNVRSDKRKLTVF